MEQQELELQKEQLEFNKLQLAHAVEVHNLNKETFQHQAKLEKLKALFQAREFAHSVVKNATWGQELQKQLEQLTLEIYPVSKLTL